MRVSAYESLLQCALRDGVPHLPYRPSLCWWRPPSETHTIVGDRLGIDRESVQRRARILEPQGRGVATFRGTGSGRAPGICLPSCGGSEYSSPAASKPPRLQGRYGCDSDRRMRRVANHSSPKAHRGCQVQCVDRHLLVQWISVESYQDMARLVRRIPMV